MSARCLPPPASAATPEPAAAERAAWPLRAGAAGRGELPAAGAFEGDEAVDPLLPPSFQTTRGGTGASETYVASAPPLAVSGLVAALLEPLVAIATLLLVTGVLTGRIDVPTRLLAAITLLLLFPGANRFYDRPMSSLRGIVLAWATAAGVLFLGGFATGTLSQFEPGVLLAWAIATPVGQAALTLAGSAWLRRRARSGASARRALVVGAGHLGAHVADLLAQRRAFGHQCVGFIDDREPERCHPEVQGRVVGGFAQARRLIEQLQVQDVYLTVPLAQQPRTAELMAQLRDAAVTIYFVPDLFAFNIIQGRMRYMRGLPVVSLLESPFVGVNALIKRVSDIVIASLILLLVAPLMLAIAVAVKFGSPGPVIFRQRRNGLDGEEIVVWKFRSMCVTEDGSAVAQATRGDPRVTRVGAVLRRTSLDELPQFFNVLQGRMSVVGPRPHAVVHNEQYRQLIDAYMIRHKVKPGITGLAQVNGFRGETDVIEKMAGRVAWDIEYLRRWSLMLDLRIILRTIRLTVFDRNAY